MIEIDVNESCMRIKEKMQGANITPKQLQEALEVTVTTPYFWLSGKNLPKIGTLLNIAELLNCKLTDLLIVSGDGVGMRTLEEYYAERVNEEEKTEQE